MSLRTRILLAALAVCLLCVPARAAGACDPASAIGTVGLSVGQAPPSGAPVCPGDSLATGAGSLLAVRLHDGSTLRLGPASEISDVRTAAGADRLTLMFGEVSGMAPRFAGPHRFALALGGTGEVGIRGAAFTASRASDKLPVILHVLEGHGFARLAGVRRVKFPAGYTAIAAENSMRLSTVWPDEQRALIPPAQRPPAIIDPRLIDPGRPDARLVLGLDRPARVVIRIFRANHLHAVFRTRGQGGLNTFAPLRRPLAPGLYIVTVKAIRGGRVSLARLIVRAL